MRGQQVFDLARADVLSLADDDVLAPSGDAQVALRVTDAEVAGAEPAVRREGLRRRCGVEIPEAALGTAREHFAFVTRRDRGAVVVDQPDLGGADRPAVRRAGGSSGPVVVMVGNSVDP